MGSASRGPGVSVVIPAYNQPRMLGEALASVRAQTAPPIEVVVIDDCSAEPLQPATPCPPGLPLRFVRQLENRGPAASVVHGIQQTRGELIAVLNHDDAWEPEFLERLTRALEAHREAGLAFCDHGIMHADGRRDERLSSAQSGRYARARLQAGLLTGGQLYRPALVDKAIAGSSFALARRRSLDLALIAAGSDTWDYFLAVGACRSAPAVYVAERLGWYRVSPTMLSATHADPRRQIALVRPQITILLVILRSPQLRSIHSAIRRRLVGTLGRAFGVALRTRRPRNVALVATQALAGMREAKASDRSRT
jgi:glycosyltransferase involved in cell wall biosynthesis